MAVEAGGIGARLRAGREKLGLTVLQVAERIHTDPKIVESIEAESYEALGAPVYARGHIRHYADLVGESANELIQMYSNISKVEQPDLTRIVKAPAGPDSNKLVAPALVVIVVFAVAGAIWWVSALSKKKPVMSETHVVTDETPASSAASTSPADSSASPEGPVTEGAAAEGAAGSPAPVGASAPSTQGGGAAANAERGGSATGAQGGVPVAGAQHAGSGTGAQQGGASAARWTAAEPRLGATSGTGSAGPASTPPRSGASGSSAAPSGTSRPAAAVPTHTKPSTASPTSPPRTTGAPTTSAPAGARAAGSGATPTTHVTPAAAQPTHATAAAQTPPVSSPAVPAPTRMASAAPATSAVDTGLAPRSKSQSQVTLRYSADSWTEVYDSTGARLFYDVGTANSVKTVVGTPPLRVVLGNASGVSVEYNGHGKPIAKLSRPDGSVQFSITRSGEVVRAKPVPDGG
ncbi:MAG: DUF4115 domain-containing protein [Proteobacteria bacterium]|nr:DUF4115 domain-containing protein [Pseudomonadota bacterium]